MGTDMESFDHEADRSRIFELFQAVDQAQVEPLNRAMDEALSAPKETLDSVDRAVLGLTGSFEQYVLHRDLKGKVKRAIGQPFLHINAITRGSVYHVKNVVGFIGGEMVGHSTGTNSADISFPVSLGIEWGEDNHKDWITPRVISKTEHQVEWVARRRSQEMIAMVHRPGQLFIGYDEVFSTPAFYENRARFMELVYILQVRSRIPVDEYVGTYVQLDEKRRERES